MNTAERKYAPEKKNLVHEIDGSDHGVAGGLLDRIKKDVEHRLNAEELEVPALPSVASRILQVSNDPGAGMEEIERLVRSDQFLAGKVLALVNSAFYSGRQRVGSLKQAVALLGLRTLRDLIFSVSLHQKVFKAKRYEELMRGTWAHSAGSAVSAGVLAERLKVERESAFLCGLLHDIGRPVLLNSIIQIEESTMEGQELGRDSVEILLADFHELVGGYVATRWKLAPNAIEAIRCHHHPARSREHHALAAIVYCADRLADHIGFGGEPVECNFTLDAVFNELSIADETVIREAIESIRTQANAFISGFAD